jgi:hypothetical protein
MSWVASHVAAEKGEKRDRRLLDIVADVESGTAGPTPRRRAAMRVNDPAVPKHLQSHVRRLF